MSESDQIAGLESALIGRAGKLAEAHVASGHEEHDRLLTATNERLRLEEEREAIAAKARAERAFQQQVQAVDLQLRAEIDRLRLDLVNAVLQRLPARLQQLAADEQRYLSLLRTWIRDGAQAIEEQELVIRLNSNDSQRLRTDWDNIAYEAAPNKSLTLGAEPITCDGGVLIASADNRIRLDNTFEGRRERLEERLQNAIAEQLAAASEKGGN